jgi:Ca-activated chloride channel family protein
MDLKAKLDFNVVAVDQGETVNLLLEIVAPGLEGDRRRDPARLQVVLDRSGSMAAGQLVTALQAIDSLIGRLHADDVFGLVVFDDAVQVPVPSGPVGDGSAIRQVLHRIGPGGMTNLGGGLLRGIQECGRTSDGAATTLVLLSDGHANQGVIGHAELESFAAAASQEGITISTIGIGLGYDEDLLEAISRGGSGNSHFAENGDEAGAKLAGEVEGLLEQVAQAASLTVRPGEEVSEVRLFNDLSVSNISGGFMVELGELVADENRKLLFEIDVPDIATLGPAQVCEIELRWVDTGTMKSKLATIPVNVNVVPGDQAAGRVKDSEVETEMTFQQVQRDKRLAAEDLKRGDIASARRRMGSSMGRLRRSDRSRMSPGHIAEYEAEQEWLAQRMAEAERDPNMSSKRMKADYNQKHRRRGRDPRGED